LVLFTRLYREAWSAKHKIYLMLISKTRQSDPDNYLDISTQYCLTEQKVNKQHTWILYSVQQRTTMGTGSFPGLKLPQRSFDQLPFI